MYFSVIKFFKFQDKKQKNVPDDSEEDIFDGILDLEEDGPTDEAVEADEAAENKNESSEAVNKNNAKSPNDKDEEMEVDDNKVTTPEPETKQKQNM